MKKFPIATFLFYFLCLSLTAHAGAPVKVLPEPKVQPEKKAETEPKGGAATGGLPIPKGQTPPASEAGKDDSPVKDEGSKKKKKAKKKKKDDGDNKVPPTATDPPNTTSTSGEDGDEGGDETGIPPDPEEPTSSDGEGLGAGTIALWIVSIILIVFALEWRRSIRERRIVRGVRVPPKQEPD